jgi:hypothetical protein
MSLKEEVEKHKRFSRKHKQELKQAEIKFKKTKVEYTEQKENNEKNLVLRTNPLYIEIKEQIEEKLDEIEDVKKKLKKYQIIAPFD